ncbi:ATP-grasp domain-containing protein [Rhodophyticola porphyridii]|uniref:ATP-grasp domain-containing protein n=1 Tax=Rhodophyticola porphyridii TaxID=1852017 RepID=UPI001F404557|nr:ATP-grasp domain-containing protein [Rhodophyticola porphyridii]
MNGSAGVLLTSAGRRVELLECFRAAARELGLDVPIFACDLEPTLSAACARADAAFQVPRCDDPTYAEAVRAIVAETGSNLVIPTIDPELMPLSEAVSGFDELGARVHVSDPATIAVVRDKARTSEVLDAAGVPVPRTQTLDALRAEPDLLSWPVFLKPSGGSASRGLAVVDRPEDLPSQAGEPMIAQDCLRGPEFTINMFVEADGRLSAVIPHVRLSVRAGEVEKGRTERRQDLRSIAEGIATALPGLRGLACFQVIDDVVQGPRVIEINARFGGGYPLAHAAGATAARWLLEEVTSGSSTAHDDWVEGVEMLRYDAAIFRGLP